MHDALGSHLDILFTYIDLPHVLDTDNLPHGLSHSSCVVCPRRKSKKAATTSNGKPYVYAHGPPAPHVCSLCPSSLFPPPSQSSLQLTPPFSSSRVPPSRDRSLNSCLIWPGDASLGTRHRSSRASVLKYEDLSNLERGTRSH